MKKFLCAVIAAIAVFSAAFCGCATQSGIDGRDGQDLDIYQIYEAANSEREKNGLPKLEFLEFLSEYLHYDYDYSDDAALQAQINRSLLSCVSVISGFQYTTSTLFGGSSSETVHYAGAGVIVELDKEAGDAYVLTNCHVVYDSTSVSKYASHIYLYLYGNDKLTEEGRITASIVGCSSTYDIALLKVENSEVIKSRPDVTAASFADGEEMFAGQTVYSIGDPSGDGMSVTVGIVSKESEEISLEISEGLGATPYRVIRTDAAINGGNSGGGLFDTSGHIVGIVNSKVISSEIDNMGYALSSSYVKRLWLLMKDGYTSRTQQYGIRRAYLDAAVSYTSSSYYDSENSVTKIKDVVILSSSSSLTGLKKADVLLNIKITRGGQVVENLPITRYFNVDDVLLSARDGDQIEYTVLRGGEQVTVTASPTFKSEN